MQLTRQEQIAKFEPFLKISIFWTLEATLNVLYDYQNEKLNWS